MMKIFPSEKELKKTVKRFLSVHPDQPVSAAKLQYSLHLDWKEYQNAFDQLYHSTFKPSPSDIQMSQTISESGTSDELLNLMRKGMSFPNKYALTEKLLEYEDELTPLIQEKSLRSGNDYFIEAALSFFLHCKENPCNWILTEYSNFRSEYMKSMLCLVLGFRGTPDMIPFLIGEAERLLHTSPSESFDQGPALAVQELAARFWSNPAPV